MREGSHIRTAVWALTIVALLYSAVHFIQSGIVFPLRQQNVAKFDEETPALRQHLETGQPVHFDNQVQYGPVFFFVVHPLIRLTHGERSFSNWLYALQLLCIAIAFVMTWATLRPLMPPRDRPLMTAWLVVLWLNFAPLYTILVIKSVETWELALLATALYAYQRDRTWAMALAVAAAALVKVLPLIFVYYLLLTNRRAFLYTCVALVMLLLVSHALYGSEMGLWYFPKLARAATGESFGLLWHENLSLKAAIAKAIGRLDTPDFQPGHGGSTLLMSPQQLRMATIIGDIAVLAGIALLTWTWLRARTRTAETILWEWSLTTVAMLILSPNTTFEYATLALGAISYALVLGLAAEASGRPRVFTWFSLGAAMFFLGVLLPRQILNRLTFVDALARWSGYSHLTPSEAYQYYCFPLAGLLLLVAALWRLRPVSGHPVAVSV